MNENLTIKKVICSLLVLHARFLPVTISDPIPSEHKNTGKCNDYSLKDTEYNVW